MSAPTSDTGQTPGAAAPAHPLRVSDVGRERVCHILHQATGAGMLTLAEAEERLAAAYAARFRHDLEPLTADLPDLHAADGLDRGVSASVRSLLASLFILSVAVRQAVVPVLARHKVLTGLAIAVSVLAVVLSVYWGLTAGEEVES